MSRSWRYALHSVSYSGSWGQAALPLHDFLPDASSLGFDGVMLMAKRPHAAPLDFDSQARRDLRGRLADAGLEMACLAGYNDLSLGMDRPDLPMIEMHAGYLLDLCRLA